MNQRTNADLLPNPADSSNAVLRFDAFAFDLRRGELRGAGGGTITLRPKADALLRCFLAEPGRLLSRDRLMTALWPATVVTDDSLVQCVGELRGALGDRGPALIRTVPRRGYRLDATVSPADACPQAEPDVPAHVGGGGGPVGPPPQSPPSSSSSSSSSSPPSSPPPAPLRRWLAIAAWLAAGCMVTGGLGATFVRMTSPPRMHIDETIAARSLVAILPFTMAADEAPARHAAQQAAQALEHDIATQFATRPGMRAIGSIETSRFASDPDPVGRAARELNASKVVTGRIGAVDGTSGTVAVEVQLVAVHPRSVMWSRRFEATLADIGAGTTDLGHHVVNAVRSNGDRPDLLAARIDERSADPAELTLLGWNALDRQRSHADARTAKRRFEQALDSDPDSLIALNGLAASYLRLQGAPDNVMTDAERRSFARIVERVRLAGPDDATSLMIWGSYQISQGHAELALPALDRAIRIAPSHANAHTLRAEALMLLGRTDEVLAEVERAVAMAHADPKGVVRAWRIAAESALMRGDGALALDLARRSVAQMPSNPQAHGVLAAAEVAAGDPARAAGAMAEMMRLWPQATVARYDQRRPSTHPAFVAQRQRLYGALLLAGLPAGAGRDADTPLR